MERLFECGVAELRFALPLFTQPVDFPVMQMEIVDGAFESRQDFFRVLIKGPAQEPDHERRVENAHRLRNGDLGTQSL